MPNILLTEKCNLRCKYCFANDIMSSSVKEISVDNFRRALDFITSSGGSVVGLIGGEPTLHSNAGRIFEYIVNYKKIKRATLYTNGLLIDKYEDVLCTPKYHLLVNCNSPYDIGDKAFEHLHSNLKRLINNRYMKDRIILGINLYSNDLDFTFIIELLEEFGFHRLRVSLTVPNDTKSRTNDPVSYYTRRKEYLLGFFRKLDQISVLPFYDCSKPPACIWTQEEREWINNYVKKYGVSDSNLVGNQCYCMPVIDISPDLSAVRCFGLSHALKVNIDDYKCYDDLVSYFYLMFDERMHQQLKEGYCASCYEASVGKCIKGCMGFAF